MRLVKGLAAIWVDVHARARDLIYREVIPERTSKLLPEWERVAGLPDPCLIAPQTIPQRRQKALGKARRIMGRLLAMAPAAGEG